MFGFDDRDKKTLDLFSIRENRIELFFIYVIYGFQQTKPVKCLVAFL